MIIGSQGDLWLWEGIDRDGVRRKYQTHGPNVPQAAMLAHLRRHYSGYKIVSCERSENPTRDHIPPRPEELGNVKAHAFEHGLREGLAQSILEMGTIERAQLANEIRRLPNDDPAVIAVLVATQDAERLEQNETHAKQYVPISERYRAVGDGYVPVAQRRP